mmetsp:Transcript_6918/g.29203  ORF Transcript_6918/g.29203 Transcript_6918/m.29203 type:complete len:371 (-) Transcript_6918:402-1514(-)
MATAATAEVAAVLSPSVCARRPSTTASGGAGAALGAAAAVAGGVAPTPAVGAAGLPPGSGVAPVPWGRAVPSFAAPFRKSSFPLPFATTSPSLTRPNTAMMPSYSSRGPAAAFFSSSAFRSPLQRAFSSAPASASGSMCTALPVPPECSVLCGHITSLEYSNGTSTATATSSSSSASSALSTAVSPPSSASFSTAPLPAAPPLAAAGAPACPAFTLAAGFCAISGTLAPFEVSSREKRRVFVAGSGACGAGEPFFSAASLFTALMLRRRLRSCTMSVGEIFGASIAMSESSSELRATGTASEVLKERMLSVAPLAAAALTSPVESWLAGMGLLALGSCLISVFLASLSLLAFCHRSCSRSNALSRWKKPV